MSDDSSPSSGRAKRQKSDKFGRFAALKKLKELKGSKNKYEVSDVDNVYDEVDEREYSKRVQERQDDDWIIDDDGGYVEDGREIFDDDLDDESIMLASKKKKRGGDHGSSKKGRYDDDPSGKERKASRSIRNMLMSMPSKKKEVSVKLEDDDVLKDVMQEILDGSANEFKTVKEEDPFQCSEESASNYLKGFAKIKPKAIPKSIAFKLAAKKKELVLKPEVDDFPVVDEFSSDVDVPTCEVDDMTIDEPDSPVAPPPEDEKVPEVAVNGNAGHPLTAKEEQVKDEGNEILDGMFDDDFPIAEAEAALNESTVLGAAEIEEFEDPLVNWEKSRAASASSEDVPPPVDVEKLSELPLITNTDGEKVLRFFWLDAHEEPFKQPGVVFLFGKVWIEGAKAHVSCCVTVRNIPRKVYLLPREKVVSKNGEIGKEVTFMDMYKEFSSKATQFNILEFKSRKVEKNYCFHPDIPQTSEYLEVKYPASCGALPRDWSGETFSHVFGTTSGALELFLLDRKLKGPCWLDIKQPVRKGNQVSCCKVEVEVDRPELAIITVTPQKLSPPPLVVLSLNVKAVVNTRKGTNEVALVAGVVQRDFQLDQPTANKGVQQDFCLIAPLSDHAFPFNFKAAVSKYSGTRLESVGSERILLSYLVTKIQRIDPDLLVGHDILGVDLEVLLHRLLFHRIPNWSKVGRLSRTLPTGNTKNRMVFDKSYVCGRLVCDIVLSSKELIRSRSYDLETLCQTVLKQQNTRPALTYDDVRRHYETSEKLLLMVTLSLQDAFNSLRIMQELNVMPLALQITNIAGNVMSRTLMGGRSERNEFLLLHAFNERNFIPPEKQVKKKGSKEDEGEQTRGKGKKKPAYAGGLVLDPKKGFYDQLILLMDFNSLYPSIIQEYNICFTTVALPPPSAEDVLPDVPPPDTPAGILPVEIQKLVESRRQVKALLKDPKISTALKKQYHIRQMALKLMANSMYGCLGFTFSRFYAKPLAALITAKGRDILMNTKDLVESLSYEVVYGDTDSIMINTNTTDFELVNKIGQQIKKAVNKLYNHVELDIDGVFKYMLLLKKKKYAAVLLSRAPGGNLITQMEQKGLDIVRRDWSRISAECGNFVLKTIMTDEPLDDRLACIQTHLSKLAEDLTQGRVPLPLLTISKQLTRAVEQYSDAKSMPHVMVASRLMKKGVCRFKPGDTVTYVICEDGSGAAATQRAYHLDEVKGNSQLTIDYKYYLANQVHPVVSRLLDPIEGMDSARIAELLGLDPTQFRHRDPEEHKDMQAQTAHLEPTERFRKCDRFIFTCVNCKSEIRVGGPYSKSGSSVYPVLQRCLNPDCNVAPLQYLPNIQNKLTLELRSHVQRYSKSYLICEDPACPQRTCYVPNNFHRAYPVCTLCKSAVMYKEVTDKELYTQLLFFQHIFDLNAAHELKGSGRLSKELEDAYGKLHEQVVKFLEHSLYSRLDLGALLAPIFKARSIKQALLQSTSQDTLLQIKQEPITA